MGFFPREVYFFRGISFKGFFGNLSHLANCLYFISLSFTMFCFEKKIINKLGC
jgi:hypothetical protein